MLRLHPLPSQMRLAIHANTDLTRTKGLQYTSQQLMWATIMHLAFVVSAVLLGYLEQIMNGLKKK
ncbi:hypothetical protein AC244_19035 [Ensifer adhaerens]|uniref:Uncharacterized protein n=1 Tax=Ensifer adhaerens TaxID=106592 RepID=A0A0L8BQN4_ENSAD|nr:hypothetical protein AC244_19035 [Ensifer adhaerens]